jgi:hypothetical protein
MAKLSRILREEGLTRKIARDQHVEKILRQLESLSADIDMLSRTRDLSHKTERDIEAFLEASFDVGDGLQKDLGIHDLDF